MVLLLLKLLIVVNLFVSSHNRNERGSLISNGRSMSFKFLCLVNVENGHINVDIVDINYVCLVDIA